MVGSQFPNHQVRIPLSSGNNQGRITGIKVDDEQPQPPPRTYVIYIYSNCYAVTYITKQSTALLRKACRPLSAEPTSMKTIEEKYYNTFQTLKSIKVADRASHDVWHNKTLLLFKIVTSGRMCYAHYMAI